MTLPYSSGTILDMKGVNGMKNATQRAYKVYAMDLNCDGRWAQAEHLGKEYEERYRTYDAADRVARYLALSHPRYGVTFHVVEA